MPRGEFRRGSCWKLLSQMPTWSVLGTMLTFACIDTPLYKAHTHHAHMHMSACTHRHTHMYDIVRTPHKHTHACMYTHHTNTHMYVYTSHRYTDVGMYTNHAHRHTHTCRYTHHKATWGGILTSWNVSITFSHYHWCRISATIIQLVAWLHTSTAILGSHVGTHRWNAGIHLGDLYRL